MTSEFTLVNWCSSPSSACDPCHCRWETLPVSSTWIYDGGGLLADSNFCGGLLLGEGANCLVTTGHALGDIVTGTVDIFIEGSWAQFSPSTPPTAVPSYAVPPDVSITVNGVAVASVTPDLTNMLDFTASAGFGSGTVFGPGGAPVYEGTWSGHCRTSVPNCILRNLSMTALLNSPGNCVLPIVGIANPTTTAEVTLITPTWADGPTTPNILFTNLFHLVGGMWVTSGLQQFYNQNNSHVQVNQPWIYKHY
jgi:hypothetical protein